MLLFTPHLSEAPIPFPLRLSLWARAPPLAVYNSLKLGCSWWVLDHQTAKCGARAHKDKRKGKGIGASYKWGVNNSN